MKNGGIRKAYEDFYATNPQMVTDYHMFGVCMLKYSYDTIMLLIKLFRIGPVTGPRLAVLDRGRRPRSNAADRGPVTGPIRNNLINEIFIN